MTTEEDNMPSSPIMVNRLNLSAIKRDSIIDTLTPNDICSMFDEFLTEFERMEKSDGTTTQIFLDAVEEITNAVLGILPFKLLDPKVLAHQMMRFLHQMLIDLLDNWRATYMRLNIQESDIFLKIVLVFVHAMDHASAANSNEDKQKIINIVATKTILSLVREQIADSNMNKNGMNDDPNLCTLGLMTIKLLKTCEFYFSKERNIYLIDILIYNCLDSYDYMQALQQIIDNKSLNDTERFLLYTCWEHIPFGSKTSNSQAYPTGFIDLFYQDILSRYKSTIDQYQSMNPDALAYIFERYTQILAIPKLASFHKHTNDIIDRLIKILDKPSSQNPDDEASVVVALEAFHNLSTHADIRPIIKKRNLTPLFNKYTSDEPGEKQKYAFAILAEIMDEKDININPSEITKAFIDQLKQLDPNRYNPELDKPLSSLNTLIQNEQIKKEFIRQDGLDILIPFIRDGDCEIQSEKQLEDAINILWSCTFNNSEASNTLKQDEKLMTRVNDILEKSKTNQNSTLEKAAEGLIWKVEKEEKFLEERAAQSEKKKKEKKQKAAETGVEEDDEDEEEAPKYDLMISYCWAEMDLAHRIFAHLTEKLGYRIWIDKEQMHGSTIEAMANAVDGAEFILMCMSESYKRSANCKSEAEYAFNRKKHIVPIKMKKDYVPDGWLGFILGTRLYIDFGTYEFEQAIKLLDNEIQLQKKKRKDAKEMAKVERAATIATESEDNKVDEQEKLVRSGSKRKSKCNIESCLDWSEQDVRQYLMENNLGAMIALCNGISGEELNDLYSMCKTNPTSMYRSLKYELLHGYNRILPIATYLRFVNRLGLVCGDGKLVDTKISKEDREENP